MPSPLCQVKRFAMLRAMATGSVYDAIKAKLTTDLGGSYAVLDWEQIDQNIAQLTVPFLTLEESDDATELMSVGSPDANWINDSGMIDVHIFVPATGSLSAARSIGDAVRASLQYQYFSAAGQPGLRVLNATQPAPGAVADGLWHSMIVTVEYENKYAVATA